MVLNLAAAGIAFITGGNSVAVWMLVFAFSHGIGYVWLKSGRKPG